MSADRLIEKLHQDLVGECELLIDVATGGADIKQVNGVYKERRRSLRERCHDLEVSYPNDWWDLWQWYGFYNRNGLDSYQARREFILDMYGPVLDRLDEVARKRRLGSEIGPDVTGWARVDEQVAQLHDRHGSAKTIEDHKAIGHLCREILISLGQAVFDEQRHQPKSGDPIKKDDAKNRIDRVLQVDYSGTSTERLRKLVRATWEYVAEATHKADDGTSGTLAANSVLHLVSTLRLLMPEPPPQPKAAPAGDQWSHPAPAGDKWGRGDEWGQPPPTPTPNTGGDDW